MVIINRNDLSIPSLNRADARRVMQGRTVAGFGAGVSPVGSPSPRPYHWPELAQQASTPGNLAQGYPVHSTGKPAAEATRLESEVSSVRFDRDYQSPDRTVEPTDLATTALPASSQLCAPATTAQK